MRRRALLKNAISLALFAGGVVLLVLLAREIGLAPVIEHARSLGWFVPIAVAIHVAVHAANTLGWYHAIGPSASNLSFGTLFGAWAAGDLVNWGTPGALGGEYLRAHLIRHIVPMSVGIASVSVARLSQVMSQFAFIGLGLVMAWTRLEFGTGERLAILVVVGGAIVVITGGYLLQRTRTFGHAVTALRGMGLKGPLIDRIEAALGRVDVNISSYHRDPHRNFRLSVAYFFLGWVIQMFEVPFALLALGAPVDWRAVVAVEALATLIEAVGFIVPGKVGVDEGGRVLVFQALAYPAAVGLGFSLFRRARELVWFAACLVILFVMKRRADHAVEAARAIAPAVAPG